MTHLVINNLVKSFENGMRAVDGVSLSIERGEIVSLLGPSGCGKTTTLRCIAGLEVADSGTIHSSNRVLFSQGAGSNISVPAEQRQMAMVFQQYALWPHFDVFENVAFGLRAQKVPKSEIPERVEVALKRVQLLQQRSRRISQLSGGQQQRVALARAFATNPDIILFDEPLSNLDARLREGMRLELLELQRAMGFTAVYVTHDQDEAFNLSSRIAVMNKGRIEQLGKPWDVWYKPATAFVADFLGSTNRLRGKVLAGERGNLLVETPDGMRIDVGERPELRPGMSVDAFVRFGSIQVSGTESAAPTTNTWKVQVRLQTFQGDNILLRVSFGRGELICRGAWERPEQEYVYITIPVSSVLCYEVADEAA